METKKPVPAGPKMYDMAIAAIRNTEDKKGASVTSIKNYIIENHPTVDQTKLKFRLRKALEKGMEEGIFTRPKSMEDKG